MRSRKKKYLVDRVEKVRDLMIFSDEKGFYDKPLNDRYNLFNLKEVFGNDNITYLEIGCGKGGFITKLAQKYPNINFLAVEKTKNIIVSAMETVSALGLDNIRFMNIDAYNLKFLLPNQCIDRIYLNFSCPYPKKTYANNRLTNPKFLEIYKMIMTPEAEIHQKTDSELLFEYSVEQFIANGFALKNVTNDLYKTTYFENITTEYEEYFVAQGKPIFRLEAFITTKK